VIIAFRGTDNTKDLYDDLKITLNKIFPRVEAALKYIGSLINTIETTQIHVTGHSLGGAIAREVGKQLGYPSITFNAAAPPTAPVISEPTETNYHIVYDIISAWQSPYTIRIDKGFRPIPTWWEKTTPILWTRASMRDILLSHSLVNFSNQRKGTIICGEVETQLLREWMISLPSTLRLYMKATLLGLSNTTTLPEMNGCYGL
jgi:pimeloyl-ACP methyl ester carboxylesterase